MRRVTPPFLASLRRVRRGLPPSSPRDREAGFTLVELLVVLVILVLLASLAAPRVIGYLGSSRTKAAKIQIASFHTALELFKLDTGRFPTNAEGLVALVARPVDLATWNGPYLGGGRLPKDPWGHDYRYRIPGRSAEVDVLSFGADNQEGGEGENQDVDGRS